VDWLFNRAAVRAFWHERLPPSSGPVFTLCALSQVWYNGFNKRAGVAPGCKKCTGMAQLLFFELDWYF
jgi:hypothetical protein